MRSSRPPRPSSRHLDRMASFKRSDPFEDPVLLKGEQVKIVGLALGTGFDGPAATGYYLAAVTLPMGLSFSRERGSTYVPGIHPWRWGLPARAAPDESGVGDPIRCDRGIHCETHGYSRTPPGGIGTGDFGHGVAGGTGSAGRCRCGDR